MSLNNFEMTTIKLTNLLIRSCKTHPYFGDLPKKSVLLSAIDLCKLVIDFAKKGMKEEAMGVEETQWNEVMKKLQLKLENA